jgi:hypothetical protein
VDKRASLILTRAKEILARDAPGTVWIEAEERLGKRIIERQGSYLSRAEHELLDEGKIESVDQS